MVKMVSLKRTKAEVEADNDAGGGAQLEPHMRDGMDLHMQEHHLEKMGIDDPLPVGHEIEIHGHGHVAGYSDDEGMGRRMHVRITHAGAKYDAPEPHSELRGELEKNTEDSERKRVEKEEKRTAKKADAGKKEPEPAEGRY